MSEEIDINEIASNVLSAQIERLLESVRATTKSWTDRRSISLKKNLDTYVKEALRKHSYARSFFYRNEPVYIYSCYVPLGLHSGRRKIAKAQAKPLFSHSSRIIIQGSGGCGKSVLIKHLMLDILRNGDKIPILVALREVNKRETGVTSLVREALKEGGLDITEPTLIHSLKKGLFALLFDGFDELNGNLRDKVAREIRSLAAASNNAWVLLTSRPDSEFDGWTEFITFNASPLSLQQAISLVGCTPIDSELKSRFIEDLQKSLFEKHKSFLSNPLLLSIMLLTYHDSADIPTKLSVFYSQAYEALFHRHDAWKGGFKRERKSGLDIHDFARVFAAFSLIAYDKGLFSLPRVEANSITKQAAELTHLNIAADNFLQDATQAVCLLVEDGLQIAYSHRSFQEYFTARFIAEAPPTIKETLLDRIGNRIRTDTVVSLLHEMQPEFVELSFVAPRLEGLFKELDFTQLPVSRDLHLRFIKRSFDSMTVRSDGEVTAQRVSKKERDPHFDIVGFAMRHCRYLTSSGSFFVQHDWKTFVSSHYPSNHETVLETAQLTTEEPLIQELYTYGMYFGSQVLTELWMILEAIRRKQSQTQQSIVELLTGKWP